VPAPVRECVAQLELARGAQVTLPAFLCAGRVDGARSPNNGHFVPRPSHPIHAQHGKGRSGGPSAPGQKITFGNPKVIQAPVSSVHGLPF
jgi:hypothetical protein